jgi:hypothetical protein
LDEITYECHECGKTKKSTDGRIPKCCNKFMSKVDLDICIQPAHAEHTRPMEKEEPCDDFRGG